MKRGVELPPLPLPSVLVGGGVVVGRAVAVSPAKDSKGVSVAAGAVGVSVAAG